MSELVMTTKRKFGNNARHFELPLNNGSKYHILNAIAKDWKEKDCLSFTFSSNNHKTVTFDLTDERIKHIGDYALTGMEKGKAIKQLSAILKGWS